jgi:RHS repeat-associated protein
VGKGQYQTDNDSGLMLLGHRYYDASVGRFISSDPAKAGNNWYAYCANNPLRRTDRSGLYFEWVRDWYNRTFNPPPPVTTTTTTPPGEKEMFEHLDRIREGRPMPLNTDPPRAVSSATFDGATAARPAPTPPIEQVVKQLEERVAQLEETVAEQAKKIEEYNGPRNLDTQNGPNKLD